MHTHTRTHTHTHIYVSLSLSLYIYIYIHNINIHIYIYIYIYICVCVCVYIYVYMHLNRVSFGAQFGKQCWHVVHLRLGELERRGLEARGAEDEEFSFRAICSSFLLKFSSFSSFILAHLSCVSFGLQLRQQR